MLETGSLLFRLLVHQIILHLKFSDRVVIMKL